VIYSDVFTLTESSIKFYLWFEPTNKKEGASKEHCAFYLVSRDLNGEPSIKPAFKLWIENTDGDKILNPISGLYTSVFNQIGEGRGRSEFVHQDQLYSPASTFVKNDTIFICCEILLLPQEFKDPCIINAGNQYFQVDKQKLMSQSAVFERIFKSGIQEARDIIIPMEDVAPKTVNAFIQYLHLHKISNLGEEAVGLYKLAGDYQVSDLQKKCAEILVDGLNSDNLFERMVIAFKHEDPGFKQGILNYMIGHPGDFKQIMISSKWKKLMDENLEMSHEIVKEFFKVMKLD